MSIFRKKVVSKSIHFKVLKSLYKVLPFHVLHGFHRERGLLTREIAILLYGASQAAINNK